MKKLVSLLAILAFALVATYAMAAQTPPETVTIKAAQAKKGPVEFPHAKHMKLVDKCSTCHHTNEGLTAANVEGVKACSECHLDPAEATTPSMREMSMKKNPFHELCINCHKEQGKGPTKCADCHK